MSFVRTKEIPPGSGNLYAYEVESYREGGKIKQRVIKYLGRRGSTGAGTTNSPSKKGLGITRKTNNTITHPKNDFITVYHGTSTANLASIKRKGLIKNFNESDSGTPDYAQNGIYVTTSKVEALHYGDGGLVTLKIPKSQLVKDETDSSSLSKDRPPSYFIRAKRIPSKAVVSANIIKQLDPAPTTVIKLTRQYPYRVWVEDRGHPLDNRILVVPIGSRQEKDIISLNRGKFVDGVNEKDIMAINDMKETKIGGITFNAITVKDAFIKRPAIKDDQNGNPPIK